MIHTTHAETETERLERQQREREAMRQAIADYTGPVTKCPPGKTTSDPYGPGKQRRPPRSWPRNGGLAGAFSAGLVDLPDHSKQQIGGPSQAAGAVSR